MFASRFALQGGRRAVFTSTSFRRTAPRQQAALLSAASLLAWVGYTRTSDGSLRKAHCCGIAGVVSHGANGDFDVRNFLLDSLTILKNRGYDSAGLATLPEEGGPMVLTRFASAGNNADAIDLVRHRSKGSSGHAVGIAHTRWATHGPKTDLNSHPHIDVSEKIALVHNGTLVNAGDLRRDLLTKGITCQGQTDSEVLAKLIGYYYYTTGQPQDPGEEPQKKTPKTNGTDLKDAIAKALNQCDGTWGLCVMCADQPDELIVACNGSPLVIGIDDDRTYVASETSAFNHYTRQFIAMRDGEIGILHKNGSSLDMGRIQVAPDQKVVLSPDPYPHWTIKECLEQPAAVTAAMNNGGRLDGQCVKLGGIDRAEDKLAHMRFLTMSACGTSLHAAKYGERLMKQLRSFDGVYSVDAAETGESDFFVADSWANSGLLVVSQSGETKDVVRVVNKAQDLGMPVISIVNAVGSLIARKTQLGVYCNAGRENAVASTKAFTTQVTVLSLIALWFRQARDREENRPIGSGERSAKLRAALLALPGTLRIAMDTRDHCKEVAELLRGKEHCFVLGKGFAEPVALEGALKIKEMCYLHAEGYSGGALKHGPFALIDDETGRFGATPVILLIFDDQHADHMRTCGEEVKARGAQLIIITDNESLARDLDPNPIVIPSNGPLTALGAVIPLQLLSYELSLIRGINPDTPRNLAKAVTVD